MDVKKPCDECSARKIYAKLFDMHFYDGEDCPYNCEEYERWKIIHTALNEKEIKKPNIDNASYRGGEPNEGLL